MVWLIIGLAVLAILLFSSASVFIFSLVSNVPKLLALAAVIAGVLAFFGVSTFKRIPKEAAVAMAVIGGILLYVL